MRSLSWPKILRQGKLSEINNRAAYPAPIRNRFRSIFVAVLCVRSGATRLLCFAGAWTSEKEKGRKRIRAPLYAAFYEEQLAVTNCLSTLPRRTADFAPAESGFVLCCRQSAFQ